MSSDGKTVTRSVYVIVLRKDCRRRSPPKATKKRPTRTRKMLHQGRAARPIRTKDKDKKADPDKRRAPKGKTSDKDKDKEKDQSRSASISTTSASAFWLFPSRRNNYIDCLAGKTGELFCRRISPAALTQRAAQLIFSKFDLSQAQSRTAHRRRADRFRSLRTAKSILYQQGTTGSSRPPRHPQNPAKARSSSTIWKCGSSRAPNGRRCFMKSGASSAISSTTRIITA